MTLNPDPPTHTHRTPRKTGLSTLCLSGEDEMILWIPHPPRPQAPANAQRPRYCVNYKPSQPYDFKTSQCTWQMCQQVHRSREGHLDMPSPGSGDRARQRGPGPPGPSRSHCRETSARRLRPGHWRPLLGTSVYSQASSGLLASPWAPLTGSNFDPKLQFQTLPGPCCQPFSGTSPPTQTPRRQPRPLAGRTPLSNRALQEPDLD